MALATPQLVSERMKNLLSCAIGGAVGSATIAIDANPENIQSTGTPVMFLPDGSLSAGVAAAELDLSDADVCAEAGVSIPAGENFAIFVIQDGTNVLCRLGDRDKTLTRASATAALVETVTWTTVPADMDNQTYVVTGYVLCTNSTNAFVVGTTSFAAAGVVDTYVNTSNLMSGTKVS